MSALDAATPAKLLMYCSGMFLRSELADQFWWAFFTGLLIN